jgi:protein-S-isoprenylcysteine O-methyltransferase Ste14
MVKMIVGVVVALGLLFGTAGRVDLPIRWTYFVILFGFALIARRRIDPDLAKERIKPGPGGTDRNLRFLILPFILAHFVVAGIDVGRFHWSDSVPVGARVVALVILAGSLLFSGWAVSVNRFYSSVVRIQSERGHHLITTGPYRWIRHPGYLGATGAIWAGAISLGSWWSLAPMVPVMALILRRTIIEDRFLHENLAGYRDYASRVRYRLVPWIW